MYKDGKLTQIDVILFLFGISMIMMIFVESPIKRYMSCFEDLL